MSPTYITERIIEADRSKARYRQKEVNQSLSMARMLPQLQLPTNSRDPRAFPSIDALSDPPEVHHTRRGSALTPILLEIAAIGKHLTDVFQIWPKMFDTLSRRSKTLL